MESISSDNAKRCLNILRQISQAITDLKIWNEKVETVDDYYLSPEGMKNLAASCMLIEAMGEGFKQVDRLTNSMLLKMVPDVPWSDVIGIRNHIAHGYFDIDGGVLRE